MAVTLDQNLGTNFETGVDNNVTLTTTATANSGTRIILNLGFTNATTTTTISSVTGGGLTWVVDRLDDPNISFYWGAVISADAPSGLASGTVITVTFDNANGGNKFIGGSSWRGLVTGASGYKDVEGSNFGTTVGWSSNTLNTTVSDLLITTNYFTGGVFTNTPTAPSIELHDVTTGGSNAMCAEYRIETAAGAYTLDGTWSGGGGNPWGAVSVAYKAAAEVATVNVPLRLGRGSAW